MIVNKMIRKSPLIFSILIFLELKNHVMISAQSRCRNPNNSGGYCISIKQCPTLFELIQKSPLLTNDRDFLIQSQCKNGFGELPHVCCTEDTGYKNTNIATTISPVKPVSIIPSSGRGHILPNTPNCGVEPYGNRIYNGNSTELDEFPWMALLEYRTSSGQKVLNCGGSLINQRYILTAAHCVKGKIEREVGTLETVRLGEYDITKDRDCIESDCADPIVEVGVEEIRAHELFDDSSNDRHNDIALIRLARDVTYSDFIKPVCLPSTLKLQRSETGSKVVVAGWGRTLQSRLSATKQKLAIPITDQEECTRKFATRTLNVRIIDSQLCAGGIFAQDSCDGDSGGPLMKFSSSFWAIEGIISFGNRCGLEGWPGVYTRVSSFENWIRENIRP